MSYDAKQKILIGIYCEYQKDMPSYKNVNPVNLDLSSEVFTKAIKKLIKEELIRGMFFIEGMELSDDYEITLNGIELIEKIFPIDNYLSGEVKLSIIGKAVEDKKENHLVDFIKNCLIEQNYKYKEYFKTHSFHGIEFMGDEGGF